MSRNEEEKQLDLPTSPPKRRQKLNPDAFPAYGPFIEKAIPYAEASGGRFLTQDVAKARECVGLRKQPTVEQNARIYHLIQILPLVDDFMERIKKGDSKLKIQCMDAQRLVVREGVEKACLSAIHQLEIERDPKIKGEDWYNLDQPFTHCTSKLLNYFDNTRAKRKDWSRTLLTAMFVTDFGLFAGLKKVPCDKDERLLENYLAKADRYSKDKGKKFSRTEILEQSFIKSLQGLQDFFSPQKWAPVATTISDGIKSTADNIKSTAAKIAGEEDKKGLALGLLASGGGLVVSGVSNLVTMAAKGTQQGAKAIQETIISKRRTPDPSPRDEKPAKTEDTRKNSLELSFDDGATTKKKTAPKTNDLFID